MRTNFQSKHLRHSSRGRTRALRLNARGRHLRGRGIGPSRHPARGGPFAGLFGPGLGRILRGPGRGRRDRRIAHFHNSYSEFRPGRGGIHDGGRGIGGLL